MGKITFIVAIAWASIAHVTPALSQTVCSIECARDRVHFTSCNSAAVERPGRDRIGIVGRVMDRGPGAYCKPRVIVDVLHGPTDSIPSHMNIDYDPCLMWTAERGHLVSIVVWERASPNTGAYTLAPCPK
jgi:hypothetical protein